jgi:hypothetical protein
MLKRLVFFVLAALFFCLRADGAEGEMELPVVEADKTVEQPLLPPSPDTADDDKQMSPSPSVVVEDATTNPQQVM